MKKVQLSHDYFYEFNQHRKEVIEQHRRSEMTTDKVLFELQDKSMSLIGEVQLELRLALFDVGTANEKLSDLQSRYIELISKFEAQGKELTEAQRMLKEAGVGQSIGAKKS